MKKSILILFLIALCVNQIQADNTFSYNGFTYEITSTTNLTVKIIRKSLGPTGYTGEVNIPETVPYSGKNFTVTEIGDYIFVDAVQLTKVTIPKTVLSIGRQVFNHCTSLQEIKVDSLNPSFCDVDGVLYTKDKLVLRYYPNAKGNVYELLETTMTIGKDAFNVSGIKTIHFNEGFNYILETAFYRCNEITSLSFPSSMKRIDENGFFNCDSIKEIKVYHTNPFTIYDNSFSTKVYLNATLLVPEGTKEKYAARTGWRNFFTITEYKEGINGDVNNDGEINISDVTALIDYLLTGNDSFISTQYSDVDGDGNINISDVTALIDILLRGA